MKILKFLFFRRKIKIPKFSFFIDFVIGFFFGFFFGLEKIFFDFFSSIENIFDQNVFDEFFRPHMKLDSERIGSGGECDHVVAELAQDSEM